MYTKSLLTTYFILLLSSAANAVPNYAGKWSINLNRFTSGSCAGVSQNPPGSDAIKVAQDKKQIAFSDQSNLYYTGKTTKTGFSGTSFLQEGTVKGSILVSISNINPETGKGTAGVIFTYTSLVTKKSCSMRFSGQAKKLKEKSN